MSSSYGILSASNWHLLSAYHSQDHTAVYVASGRHLADFCQIAGDPVYACLDSIRDHLRISLAPTRRYTNEKVMNLRLDLAFLLLLA